MEGVDRCHRGCLRVSSCFLPCLRGREGINDRDMRSNERR
jgi:hypothetical protein